jgi:hypothetical protein
MKRNETHFIFMSLIVKLDFNKKSFSSIKLSRALWVCVVMKDCN